MVIRWERLEGIFQFNTVLVTVAVAVAVGIARIAIERRIMRQLSLLSEKSMR